MKPVADKKKISNVLSSRYASAELSNLWSPEHKIIMERQLWIAVMRAQKDLGVDIPAEAIDAYEAVIEQVDLDSIADRERVTRHDVKARIEEFNALAGYEHIHKGMTSRDLTENVEQLQIYRSLELVRDKAIAVVSRIGDHAAKYQTLVMAGRSTMWRRRLLPWASVLLLLVMKCCWLSSALKACSAATRCVASRAQWAPPRICWT